MEQTGQLTGVLPVRLGTLSPVPELPCKLDLTGHPTGMLPVREGILPSLTRDTLHTESTRPFHRGVVCPAGVPPRTLL